jgi:hypothetical protein
MASTAVSKYRTSVKVSTGTTATKTITGITAANPVVVTSSAHALAVGAVVKISGVVGMTEINGRVGVITAQDTNTFTLGGIDGTGFTAWASGGVATPHTMTQVENVTNWDRSSDEADRVDATNLMSTKKEYIIGLSGEGTVTLTVDVDATGPGQAEIREYVGVDSEHVVTVARSDGKAQALNVKWTSLSESFPDKHTGTFTGVVTGPVAWYA